MIGIPTVDVDAKREKLREEDKLISLGAEASEEERRGWIEEKRENLKKIAALTKERNQLAGTDENALVKLLVNAANRIINDKANSKKWEIETYEDFVNNFNKVRFKYSWYKR